MWDWGSEDAPVPPFPVIFGEDGVVKWEESVIKPSLAQTGTGGTIPAPRKPKISKENPPLALLSPSYLFSLSYSISCYKKLSLSYLIAINSWLIKLWLLLTSPGDSFPCKFWGIWGWKMWRILGSLWVLALSSPSLLSVSAFPSVWNSWQSSGSISLPLIPHHSHPFIPFFFYF